MAQRRLTPDERDRIVEMRLRGVPVRTVAAEIDTTTKTVQRVWSAYLDETAQERAEATERTRSELIARQDRIARDAHRRYEAAVADATTAAEPKDAAAFQRVALAALAEERQALREIERLTGAAAPTRTEVTGRDGGPIELEGPKERLAALLSNLAEVTQASADTEA